jgi:hypothetical protein
MGWATPPTVTKVIWLPHPFLLLAEKFRPSAGWKLSPLRSDWLFIFIATFWSSFRLWTLNEREPQAPSLSLGSVCHHPHTHAQAKAPRRRRDFAPKDSKGRALALRGVGKARSNARGRDWHAHSPRSPPSHEHAHTQPRSKPNQQRRISWPFWHRVCRQGVKAVFSRCGWHSPKESPSSVRMSNHESGAAFSKQAKQAPRPRDVANGRTRTDAAILYTDTIIDSHQDMLSLLLGQ